MIEWGPKTFMPIQTPDVLRVFSVASFSFISLATLLHKDAMFFNVWSSYFLVLQSMHFLKWSFAQWINYVVGAITHLNIKKFLDSAKSQFAEEILARFVPQTLGLNFHWYKNQYLLLKKFDKAGKNHVV